MTPHSVHESARRGYGVAAGAYERGRPSYPAEAVDWLVGQLAAGPGAEVLEIGAGTGKFTVELVARGVRVVAVEPVAAMRERLSALGPNVQVVDAVAERLPFGSGTVGALLATQSLHWFDVERALVEFDRVVVPGGSVGLVWNFRDVDVPWQRELDELLSELRGPAVPHSRDGRWQRAVERSALGIVATRSWRWSHATNLDGVLERVRSVSYVADLGEASRRDVEGRVRALVARHPLDAAAIEWPYVTEAYVLRRRDDKEYAAAL